MQLRFLVLLPILALVGCSSAEKKPVPAAPATTPPHGLTWKLLHPFAHSDATPAPAAAPSLPPPPEPVSDFAPKPQHGLTWRVLHPFSDPDKSAPVKTGVEVAVVPDSTSPSLGEVREINLKIQVINHTNNLINLAFPTSQRIEIIVRTAEGKIIHTWSEDHTFTQDFTSVVVNPGERIEYNETIPTREMSAGKSYLVTVSIVGQTGLSTSITLTPKA